MEIHSIVRYLNITVTTNLFQFQNYLLLNEQNKSQFPPCWAPLPDTRSCSFSHGPDARCTPTTHLCPVCLSDTCTITQIICRNRNLICQCVNQMPYATKWTFTKRHGWSANVGVRMMGFVPSVWWRMTVTHSSTKRDN